jgi:hypothetical protein
MIGLKDVPRGLYFIPAKNNACVRYSTPSSMEWWRESPWMFEVQALFGSPTQPGGVIANPRRPWTVINVQVQLQDVADLMQVSQQRLLTTTAQELTGDWYGYQQRSALTSVTQPVGTAPTQALGAALFAVSGLEGFLTLSARLPYHKNLVVFPKS